MLQFLRQSAGALLLAAAAALMSSVHGSAQFHLSLAGDATSDYYLQWVTPSRTNSNIFYGASASALTRVAQGVYAGEVEEDDGKIVHCWTARLIDLPTDQVVHYALSNSSSSSSTDSGSFRAHSAKSDLTWAVFADLGAAIQGKSSGIALRALENAATRDAAYDAVLNLGDLSYELAQANGKDYMERLAPITSRVPMQITTGNHEYMHALAPMYTLRNYDRRFAAQRLGMGAASGSKSGEFFSFNSGLVHFVILNTELYGNDLFVRSTVDGEYKEASEDARASDALKQAEWLRADLQRVDRRQTPYVVVGSHRCPFKTPKSLDKKSNRFGVDIVPLLDTFAVDLYLCGHTHHYVTIKETKWNGYRIPPIIVSGAPGNADGLDTFSDINLGTFEADFHVAAYGYGYLKASATQLMWQWGRSATSKGEPTDWMFEHLVNIPRR